MSRTIPHSEMHQLYYDINPTPHSEKAYRQEDSSPSIAQNGTVVGASGKVNVLVTTIGNKGHDKTAEYAIHSSPTGHEIRRGSGTTPFVAEVSGFASGDKLYIQPLTIGTMAKILTPEQIASAKIG